MEYKKEDVISVRQELGQKELNSVSISNPIHQKSSLIDQRKSLYLKFLKKKKNYCIYFSFVMIMILGFCLRLLNLPLLEKKSLLGVDPYIFLRYSRYVLEFGSFPTIDMLRYYPIGWTNFSEFRILTYLIVYLYKFIHLLIPSMTIELANILYPPILFAIGLFFFFLLVKKLFDWRVALLSSVLLAIVPAYLFRTMAGFADKEALAMALLFLALYLFILSKQEEVFYKKMLFASLSGVVTALTGLTWGGVTFLFLIIGTTILINLIFFKFSKEDYYAYLAWIIPLIFILQVGYGTDRFSFKSLIVNWTNVAIIIALFVTSMNYLIYQQKFVKLKLNIFNSFPKGLFVLTFSGILGIIALIVLFGPSFIFERLSYLVFQLSQPFASNVWSLTVAEGAQPYFTDLLSYTSWLFMILFILGSILLFYELVQPIKKHEYLLTALFSFMILGILFNRYSNFSILDGTSQIALIFYFGSILLFGITVLYVFIRGFYTDKKFYARFKKINWSYVFILVWLFFMLIAARSAARLIFVAAPVLTIFVAYFLVKIFDFGSKHKDEMYKYGSYILTGILILILFYSFSVTSIEWSQNSYPTYDSQWENAMGWVQENTTEDSVFAQWWDYGYWIQAEGNRATLSDGGNARGAINYFMGRHLLTAENETEALEFLAANEADYLLIMDEEIIKYSAYSAIGSDSNFDKLSMISTFNLEIDNIQQDGDKLYLIYEGFHILDEDLIYDDELFPRGSYITGFMLEMKMVQTLTTEGIVKMDQELQSGQASLYYNGNQMLVPLKNINFRGEFYEYDNDGLGGVLMIIPYAEDSETIVMTGSSLYIPEKVQNTLFAQLYLFDNKEEYSHFNLVYSDEDRGWPLINLNGLIRGPFKIWEISYPENLNIPKEYYGTVIPDENVGEV
ncbi:MAG: STT3 domain-containing protein [archaeon]